MSNAERRQQIRRAADAYQCIASQLYELADSRSRGFSRVLKDAGIKGAAYRAESDAQHAISAALKDLD